MSEETGDGHDRGSGSAGDGGSGDAAGTGGGGAAAGGGPCDAWVLTRAALVNAGQPIPPGAIPYPGPALSAGGVGSGLGLPLGSLAHSLFGLNQGTLGNPYTAQNALSNQMALLNQIPPPLPLVPPSLAQAYARAMHNYPSMVLTPNYIVDIISTGTPRWR